MEKTVEIIREYCTSLLIVSDAYMRDESKFTEAGNSGH